MKLLLFDITTYDDELLMRRWGVLYSEFNTKKLALLYYVAFFLRRLLLAMSFTFLKDYPKVQILTCSLSCVIVIYIQFLTYLIIVRPYKDRIQNIINGLNELAITIGYTSYILFILDCGIDQKSTGWMIIGCIGGTYFIHNLYIIYKLISKIASMISQSYSAVKSITPASTAQVRSTMSRLFNIK